MGILNFGNKKKEKSSAMIATLPVTNQSTSATEEVEATQPTPDATKEKKPLTVSYATGWPIDVIYGYLQKNNEEKGFSDALVKSDLAFRDMNMNIIRNKILMVFREINLNYDVMKCKLEINMETCSAAGLLSTVYELENQCQSSRLTKQNCKSWKTTSETAKKRHPFRFSPTNVVSLEELQPSHWATLQKRQPFRR